MSDVFVEPLSLDKYAPIIGETKIGEIKGLADKLAGKSICHVNSTSFGGGVAEILQRLIPLMQDIGLKAYWRLIRGSDEFFNVTKSLHNGLQDMKIPLIDKTKKLIWNTTRRSRGSGAEPQQGKPFAHGTLCRRNVLDSQRGERDWNQTGGNTICGIANHDPQRTDKSILTFRRICSAPQRRDLLIRAIKSRNGNTFISHKVTRSNTKKTMPVRDFAFFTVVHIALRLPVVGIGPMLAEEMLIK